jgi:acyl-coenzyme A synthetase/AMP-(fatty) acid ligase
VVAAFVQLKPGLDLSEADLLAGLEGKLAEFKQPRRVSFVTSLPRNSAGKILKRELRAVAPPAPC